MHPENRLIDEHAIQTGLQVGRQFAGQVAEGVERPGQLSLLAQCGPITVQGFLLAAPVEMQITPQTAEAASDKARLLLEGAADATLDGTRASEGALVFVGTKSRRRT